MAAGTGQQGGEQINDDGGGEPSRIGVDQKEDRLVTENLFTLIEQLPEMILELPHFSRATPSVSRRIHNDRIVFAAPFDFAADKFEAIIRNVADGRIGEAGEHRIFFAPFNHAFGRINVADAGTRGRGGDRGGPGITEKIENVDFATWRRAPL